MFVEPLPVGVMTMKSVTDGGNWNICTDCRKKDVAIIEKDKGVDHV